LLLPKKSAYIVVSQNAFFVKTAAQCVKTSSLYQAVVNKVRGDVLKLHLFDELGVFDFLFTYGIFSEVIAMRGVVKSEVLTSDLACSLVPPCEFESSVLLPVLRTFRCPANKLNEAYDTLLERVPNPNVMLLTFWRQKQPATKKSMKLCVH